MIEFIKFIYDNFWLTVGFIIVIALAIVWIIEAIKRK